MFHDALVSFAERRGIFMKKLILGILLLGTMTFCCGCTEFEKNERFVEIGGVGDWTLIYDAETKVEYAVYRHSAITVLLNADGTPILYDGE